MGSHGPFHRTMAIQTLEITLGFSPFENQEWTAWLLDVHSASLPWAVGWGHAFRKPFRSLTSGKIHVRETSILHTGKFCLIFITLCVLHYHIH